MASTTSSGTNTGGSGATQTTTATGNSGGSTQSTTATGGGVGATQSAGTTTNNMTEAELKTMLGGIMLFGEIWETFGVAWMCQSFKWIYWNDDAFTILIIGLLVWGWFRVMTKYRWVLRLGLPRKKKKKRQCKRNWRNGTKEFQRRKLPYHLVRRCCCRRERLGQRPPRHDGNRLPSSGLNRRWRRMKKRQRCYQTRKEEQSARETQMREYIEFCELSRPKPRHVDAPVWESLLNWLCFKSPCSDDFPTNRRVRADPIVETNDELASRLKQFIEEEDHEANVTRLLARAAEHKAGGPEQKRNSHQHNKSRFRSVLRPFQRVSHASGRTALTCRRYHGGTIYVGCSDYTWTVDEKLEKLLPTDSYGYAEVGEDGELVYRSSQLAATSSEIAERRSRRRSLAWPQREQAREGAGSRGSSIEG